MFAYLLQLALTRLTRRLEASVGEDKIEKSLLTVEIGTQLPFGRL